MKRFLDWFSGLSVYLALSPFLLLYLLICIFFAPGEYVGDESRYVYFANNLLQGFYSPPFPNVNLWNGPGYPVFIAPFLFFKLPLLVVRLVNGVLLYCSLIIHYKTIRSFTTARNAMLVVVCVGLYFPVFEMLPLILTEILTWFLLSLICYLFCKALALEKINWRTVLFASFTVAFLVMTKVIFGYVVLAMLLVSGVFNFIPAYKAAARRSLLIFLVSFVFCLPWLLYTYGLTQKTFYWGNSGGMNLYAMSSPYSDELGDWTDIYELRKNPKHSKFMDSIKRLNSIEQDEAFKKAAVQHIRQNPQKYMSNWVANVGRLLFSYPYSHTPQSVKTYWSFLPNMFVFVFIVLSIGLAVLHFNKIPEWMVFLFLFVLIYLFGSSLLSAYRRMFYVTIPFWAIFMSYICARVISIRFRKG